MPVVTRADCSKLEWNGQFVFLHKYRPSISNNMIKIFGPVTFSSVECDGVNGQINDLGMYYEKLYLEAKVNEKQKALFDQTVVGHGNCNIAVREKMSNFSHWASGSPSNNTSSSSVPTSVPFTSFPLSSHPSFPPTSRPTSIPIAAWPNSYTPHSPSKPPTSTNYTSGVLIDNMSAHEQILEPPPSNHSFPHYNSSVFIENITTHEQILEPLPGNSSFAKPSTAPISPLHDSVSHCLILDSFVLVRILYSANSSLIRLPSLSLSDTVFA